MTEPTASEPSMDEILASIRRIISEDDAPGAVASATPRAADEDVLLLTRRAPPETEAQKQETAMPNPDPAPPAAGISPETA